MRRRLEGLALAAALLAGAASVGGCRRGDGEQALASAEPLRAAPAPAPPPTGAPAPSPTGFGVTEVVGRAERDRGGRVQPLAVGDVIEGSDAITTGRASALALRDASGARLQLLSSTELRLEPTAGGVGQRPRLRLERGRLRATAAEGGSLAVHAGGGEGSVESVGSDFTVQAEPGVVRVVPHANKVTLLTRDDRIDVEPGDGAEVAAGRRPVLSRVPPSLLLRVRWPEGPQARRDRQLRVAGETAPGALVRSGGAEAVADAHGRFSLAVPLREGQNLPRVTAEDLAGRRQTSIGQPVLVDSSPPDIAAEGVHY